ncbi:MAG: hypothetical protein WCG08_12510 [Paludibacter sp.]|jgi:hypothetical protein
MITAKESDIIARKTAAYLQEIQQQPKSIFISENKAFDLYRQCNVTQWRADGLIQAHQRKGGRIEYKVTELQLAAAEIQYPIHKIRILKNKTV